MKRILSAIVFGVLLCASDITAQTTFQSIESDPSKVNNGYIGLTYIGVDAGFKNLSGASLFSIGVDALYPINDKIKVEAVALYSLLSIAKEGPAFLFNPGAEYTFSSNTKRVDNVPVLLSFTTETDWYKGEQISSWSAVKLPGDIQTDYVARAGLYMRNSALEYEEGTTYYDMTNLFHAGAYVGVGRNTKHYLHVRDSDGNVFASGRFMRTYGDILILPTSVDLELTGTPTKEVSGTLGWRVGAILQLVPFTEENNFDRKIGFLGNATWRLELGQRPLEGLYITTGLSWVLKKF